MGRPKKQAEAKMVFGEASWFIEQAFNNLARFACRPLVPELTNDEVVELCVNEYHKEQLADIRRIAGNRLRASTVETFSVHIATHDEYVLNFAIPCHIKLPIRPDYVGPCATYDVLKYVKLVEYVQPWVNMTRKMTLAREVFRYFNIKFCTYNKKEIRFLLHGLPPILERAAAHAKRNLTNSVLDPKEYAKTRNAYNILLSSILNLAETKHTHAPHIPQHMMHEVAEANASIAQALVISSDPSMSWDNDFASPFLSREGSFQPSFTSYNVRMCGLNPWGPA